MHARSSGLPAALLALAAACSTGSGVTDHSVVVPGDGALPAGDDASVEAYYRSVFLQMREALRSGDQDGLRELRFLIHQHRRDDMIASARRKLEHFEQLADGLEFELSLPSRCEVRSLTNTPHAQGRQRYEFVLRPGDVPLELGGSDERGVTFQAVVHARDFDFTGEFVDVRDSIVLSVTERTRVTDRPLRLPFELPGASARTSIRELMVLVEVLPCVVRVDGRDVPVSQFSRHRLSRAEVEELPAADRLRRPVSGHAGCAAFKTLLYPEGYESIRDKPLATMRSALARRDAKYFRHVFLAAHFMPEADAPAAMQDLVRVVRVGDRDSAQVAMGALRVLSREDLPITDRRAWLRWWQERAKEK